ncbi:MAG: fatty acid--CoA ligase family protein [Pseudomonadota bacterium]
MEARNWVERLLIQRAGDPEIGCNTLGDELERVPYAALPEQVQLIGDRLVAGGMGEREHVALECENSLPTLLTLLTLLAQGRSVVLLPRGVQAPTPPFCRVRVLAQASSGPGADVSVATNSSWCGAEAVESRLYVRTSGTTGAAKLAVHTLQALEQNARNCVERFALGPEDRVVMPVAQAHMFGLGAGLLPALLAGASIELQAKANVLTYFARERAFEPTVAYLTPAFCQALLRARRGQHSYRLTVTAGDRIAEDVFREYERVHGSLVCLYGSTELGAIAASSPTLSLDARAVSVGHAMTGVTLRVLGEEGEVGELAVEHPCGFSGYANAQGEPERPSGGSAHRTADLGRRLADGRLQVLGRLDHRVKRDGKMVAYSDVEAALESLPALHRVVAFADHSAVPGPRGSLLVACYSAEQALDSKVLRRASLNVLERHAMPDRFVHIAEWPTLPSGKIDRQALVEQHQRLQDH